MTYSVQPRETWDDEKSHKAFIERVERELFPPSKAKKPAWRSRIAVALIGGTDQHSLTVRRAQSVIRFDGQPSLWSHMALLLGSPSGRLRDAVGVEVALDPEDSEKQVPERNGVTLFQFKRYLSPSRYPNLCVVTAVPKAAPKSSKGKKAGPSAQTINLPERLLKVAMHPMAAREQYPLWRLLGPWKAYLHDPDTIPNPLTQGTPLPSAALLEYAFEAADFDLFPNAVSTNACPEIFYGTLRYWGKRLGEMGLALKAHFVERDSDCARRERLEYDLEEDFQAYREG